MLLSKASANCARKGETGHQWIDPPQVAGIPLPSQVQPEIDPPGGVL